MKNRVLILMFLMLFIVPVCAVGQTYFTKPVVAAGDSQFFSAVDAGLDEGNTAAQNDTALTALIATVHAAGGGTIYAAPGRYPLTDVSLSGTSNIRVLGEYGATIFDNSGEQTSIFYVDNTSGITFERLTFLGDFDTNADATGDFQTQKGIRTDNGPAAGETRGLLIRDVISENLMGEMVRLGPNTFDVTLDHNQMKGGLGFLELTGVDDGAGDYRPVRNITVTNNKIQGTATAPNSYRPWGVNGSDDIIDMWGPVLDVVIDNNEIDNNGDVGIDTVTNGGIAIYGGVGGDTDLTVKGIVISNNTFSNFISTNATAQAAGRECWAINVFEIGETPITTTDQILITGNQFNNNGYALWHRKTINQTQFRGNSIRGGKNGVYVLDSKNLTIQQNHFYGLGGSKGIRVQGDNIVIDGNTFHASDYQDDDFENSLHAEIYATLGANRVITNNKLFGNVNVDYGIRIVNGTDSVIRENTIMDYQAHGIQVFQAAATRTRIGFNSLIDNAAEVSDSGTDTRFDTVTGRNVQTRNLRGSITITDTANTGQVTFPVQEITASYHIFLQVVPNGATAANSRTASVQLSSKTVNGFGVTLQAAPGGGLSNRIDWMIIQ